MSARQDPIDNLPLEWVERLEAEAILENCSYLRLDDWMYQQWVDIYSDILRRGTRRGIVCGSPQLFAKRLV
jgi:hypothetical protein